MMKYSSPPLLALLDEKARQYLASNTPITVCCDKNESPHKEEVDNTAGMRSIVRTKNIFMWNILIAKL